ncbi:MAG: hypothetical protein RL001_1640 [Pseudomonadota bacterium]|jgi:hypothetical protein
MSESGIWAHGMEVIGSVCAAVEIANKRYLASVVTDAARSQNFSACLRCNLHQRQFVSPHVDGISSLVFGEAQTLG